MGPPTTSTLSSVQTIIWEMISSITSKAHFLFPQEDSLLFGVFLLNSSQSSRSWLRLQRSHKGLSWLLVGPAPSETGGLIAPDGVVTKLLSHFYWLPDFLGGTFSLLEGFFTSLDLASSLFLVRASLPNTGSLAHSKAQSTNSARSAKHITPSSLFFLFNTWSLHLDCKLAGSLETTDCLFGAW